jgi:phosphomannomutase
MYGLEVIETPVGFKYVGEEMRLRDVLIGGEESGGMSVKGHIPEKDGIMSNLLVVEMLAYEGKPLSHIWADLLKEAGRSFYYRRGDLMLTPATQHGLIERLKNKPFESIGSHKIQKTSRADGFKFYIDENTWVLVRPSGTEPLFRLYFEATTEAMVEDMVQSFNKQVNAIVDELNKQNALIEAKA